MSSQIKQEVITQVVYALPPVSVYLGIWERLAGITLDHWVGYSSILYCTLQSIYLLYRWFKELKNKEKNEKD